MFPSAGSAPDARGIRLGLRPLPIPSLPDGAGSVLPGAAKVAGGAPPLALLPLPGLSPELVPAPNGHPETERQGQRDVPQMELALGDSPFPPLAVRLGPVGEGALRRGGDGKRVLPRGDAPRQLQLE